MRKTLMLAAYVAIIIVLFATEHDARIFPIYLLPTFVAVYRQHHNSVAIGILNLLLGWTGLGWVAALVWASTYTRTDTVRLSEVTC